MKFKLTLFALLFFSILSYGQKEPTISNTIKTNSISLDLIGAPAWPLGVSYGQMLNDRLSFELGIGIASLGAGSNIYITNPRYHRLNVYTGLFASINYDGYLMFYLPAGVSYFGKNNFQYSIDVGLLSSENVSLTGNDANPSPWFGLKVGYRFGEDIAMLKVRERTTAKNILSISLGIGDPIIGVNYERLVTPFLGAEAGLGVFGVSAGAKFYFPSISKGHLSFHTGVSESWGLDFWNGIHGFRTYFPLGVNLLAKNNLRFSFDAGPQIYHQENNSINLSLLFKIGKAF